MEAIHFVPGQIKAAGACQMFLVACGWTNWDQSLRSVLVSLGFESAQPFWRILRLYHRVVVFGFDSESICQQPSISREESFCWPRS